MRRTLWLLPVAGIAAASALGGLVGSAKSTPIDRTSETLQCTNGALDTTGATPARSFSLTARRGQIATADGNSVPMWGFADGDGAYQYPSPFLCANEGEDVTIALRNDLGVTQTGSGTVAAATSSTTLPIPGGAAGQQVTVGGAIYNVVSATATDVTLDGTVTVVAATPYVIGNPIRTSLMLPGMNGVLSDGSPATPEFVAGTPASGVQSLIQSVNNGETISYTFNAGRAGSFLYESGTNSATQIQMGLFGGLVVHAAAYSDLATGAIGRIFTPSTNEPAARTAYSREYVQMLSDVDPDLHQRVDNGTQTDMSGFVPRYWFINGRSFPDTIAPNNAEWLPSQPYSGIVHVKPVGVGAGYDHVPAVIRYFNASETAHPFHPHAADTIVVGVDAQPLTKDVSGTFSDLKENHFAIEIAPGQTVDSLWSWNELLAPDRVSHWDPVAKPIPVPLQDFRDQRYTGGATWYGGSPYLGYQDDLPNGVTSFNECGEYYHVAHSHALNEATTYGAAMGGMLTLYRIDPPTKNFGCKP